MTLEDLQKLKDLRAGMTQADIPQMSPEAAADPYNRQAQDYNKQATDLEAQAAQPRPEPQGAKEHLISALRAAMENFGRYGAPGGYYGQEQLRQQEFDKQNATRLAQAKEFRGLGQTQEQLGLTAEAGARTENYQQGQLEETRRLRDLQEKQFADQSDIAHQGLDLKKNAPVKMTPGEILVPPTGGTPIATNPKADTSKDVKVGQRDGPDNTRYVTYMRPDKTTYELKLGAQRDSSGAGSNSALAVEQGKDQNGNPNGQFYIVDKPGATARPVTIQGTDGKPLQSKPTAQTTNRTEQAGIVQNYADHLDNLIDQAGPNVGPLIGRLMRGEIKLGDVSPNVRALFTGLKSFEALQPIMHGFRGGSQTVEHFREAIGGLETNPAALKASIGEIRYLAQAIRNGEMEDGSGPAPAAASPSGNKAVNWSDLH